MLWKPHLSNEANASQNYESKCLKKLYLSITGLARGHEIESKQKCIKNEKIQKQKRNNIGKTIPRQGQGKLIKVNFNLDPLSSLNQRLLHLIFKNRLASFKENISCNNVSTLHTLENLRASIMDGSAYLHNHTQVIRK